MTCTLMEEQHTYDLLLHLSSKELQVLDDSPKLELENQKLGVFMSLALGEQMPEGLRLSTSC